MLRAVKVVLLALAACGSSNTLATTGDAASSDGTAAIDAPAITADAGACGMRAGARGLSHRSVMVGSANRTYEVYLPAGVEAGTPIPFVYIFHGYTMSGQAMYDVTQYAALADSEHIAVVFPDGQGGPNSLGAPWNVGTNVCPSLTGPPPDGLGDDFGFMDAMRADVEQDQCIDSAHVFASGFSMGGYMSHQVGCMRPDIRAVAPHSGGTHTLDSCITGHTPIIMFHGASDPVIPPGCDDPTATAVSGVTPSATAWAAKNGCATTTTTITVDNGSCDVYDGCPADGQVEICRFTGMGHCWAGGPSSAGIYACPAYASATQLEWAFWKQYAW